jgi:multidrug efflux pump subunit AcrA (membrane-fusion protein)
VTWIAPEGSVVSRGQPLYAIDGQPVVVFYGELPLFRSLRFRGARFSDFDWMELNNAHDDERKAELNLAAQRARVAEAQARLDEVNAYVADTIREQPTTPQFIRLTQAVAAARDRLHRIEQLAEQHYTTAAEVQQARVDLAAAQAELDATRRDRVQQRAAAQTALADARVAVQAAERVLRDAHDASNALLSSAKENLDIDMLQKNLSELGYTGPAESVIRRWQKDSGRPATGLIEPGQIVVAAGPVRVAAHLAEVGAVVYSRMDGQSGLMPGANNSNQIVRYTSTEKIVTVPLEVADHDYAKAGDAVVVTLPTNVKVPGVIRKVSAQFDAQGKANTEIEVPKQDALGSLEAASVDVEFVIGKRSDVLAVPITALVALADGGFGVEIVEGKTSRMIPVTTGLFARGHVEISGKDIAEGVSVRVPK